MNKQQWKKAAAILLLVAVPALVPMLLRKQLNVAWSLSDCGSFKVTAIADPSRFSFDGLTGKDGSPIYGGKRFSQIEGGQVCGFSAGLLSFHGRTSLPDTANIWVLSTSDTGPIYLVPRAQLGAGEWIVPDILMGSNVVKLTFLQVDADTDLAYRDRVARNDWWDMSWPTGATELASLSFVK